jgi:hypothetical protein
MLFLELTKLITTPEIYPESDFPLKLQPQNTKTEHRHENTKPTKPWQASFTF